MNVLEGMLSLAGLVPLARAAVAQVLRASEWRELWDDAHGFERALTTLKPVLAALELTPLNTDQPN